MSEQNREDDQIDVENLPQAGNSNARIYPPIEEADDSEGRDEDPQQPATGDAAAVREGEEGAGQSE